MSDYSLADAFKSGGPKVARSPAAGKQGKRPTGWRRSSGLERSTRGPQVASGAESFQATRGPQVVACAQVASRPQEVRRMLQVLKSPQVASGAEGLQAAEVHRLLHRLPQVPKVSKPQEVRRLLDVAKVSRPQEVHRWSQVLQEVRRLPQVPKTSRTSRMISYCDCLCFHLGHIQT